MKKWRTDVLIVGAGIAGAALACALRDSGLEVLLLEKRNAPLDTARGDHLQPRTVDILARWGVLDEFLANGAEKRLGSIWYSAEGEPLLHASLTELDLPHPYYLYLNHELIGETLLGAALGSPDVRIERPIRNWWLERRDAKSVEIRVGRAAADDVLVEASLVVGADGRSSRSRRQFAIAAESYRYARPIAVLFATPAARGEDNDLEVHLNPRQMVAVIPRTGGGCKIGVPVDRDDIASWRTATPAALGGRLNELAPHLELRDVRYADVYPPIFLRAESWVADNVVLIGDACHAIHPARSQGMNVAIRCVDALAGALRERAARPAPDGILKLLADYEAGLRPSVDAMLDLNHRHGLAMDRSGAADYAETCASLERVQADPAVRRRFTMDAAGYPS